nr:hypothetical protein [Deinococcus betulae]
MTDPKLIQDAFDAKSNLYSALAKKVSVLIEELLSFEEIRPHSIPSRVKNIESLKKKCIKKAKYVSIDEVTDIVGIRIITLMESDIDRVAEVIEREFEIDKANSIDKRSAIEPDKFGYLSLHYVVRLTDERIKMTEYSQYKDLPFEIQIRSVLQHAWAEIEHDLGYKAQNEIPKLLKRKFSQAASLLEVADRTFNEIKREIDDYVNKVKSQINDPQSEILIDLTSLTTFVEGPMVRKVEDEIISATGIFLSNSISPSLIDRLLRAGFTTIGQLSAYYQKNIEDIKKFEINDYEAASNIVNFVSSPKGFSIHGMCLLKDFRSGADIEEILGLNEEVDENNYIDQDLARETLNVLKRMVH